MHNVKDKIRGGSIAKNDGGGGMVYFLGFIGAAIYFVQTAENFWDGVIGILQAIIWPVYLVLEVFQNFYG